MPPKQRIANPYRRKTTQQTQRPIQSQRQAPRSSVGTAVSHPDGELHEFENASVSGSSISELSHSVPPPCAPNGRNSTNTTVSSRGNPSDSSVSGITQLSDSCIALDDDDTTFSQVPAVAPMVYTIVPVVENVSPPKADTRPSLKDVRSSRKNDGLCLLNELSKKHKKEKKRAKPKDEICTFLREPLVNKRYAEFSKTGKVPGTASAIGACMRNWHAESEQQRLDSLPPFGEEMGKILLNGRDALTNDMGRIWLEDFMTLSADDELTMLIAPSHRFLVHDTKRKTYAIGLSKDTIRSMMMAAPLRPVQIGSLVYFALKIKVRSNPHSDFLSLETFDRSDTFSLLKVETGAGVVFNAPAVDDEGVAYVHTFTCFFVNLLVDPLQLMFWKRNYHAGCRISSIKKSLDKMSDHFRMHALVHVYRDYVYGDRMQYYAIYAYLNARIAKKESKIEIASYHKAPISDAKLKKEICLKASDDRLRVFMSMVDNVCRNVIDNLYGRFSVYASPIISQEHLNAFVRTFKSLLPAQYKTLTYLIGKEGRDKKTLKHKWMWDRYTLYLFFIALRIRNSGNLTWWSMINAAGEYSHSLTGSKIPLFFGISTSKRTLLRSLAGICPLKQITERTIRTLSSIRFVIGIFDNSQIITERKFQRGGKSSEVTLVTARMFVKAMYPKWLHFVEWAEERPQIVYVDQNIPSPYGMPEFERIEDVDASVFCDEKWVTTTSSMDVTGSRVEQYSKLVDISRFVGRLVSLLPFWISEFEFSSEEHNQTLSRLSIIARFKQLSKRRQGDINGGLMWNIRSFQRNCTYTWRNGGYIPPASAIIPPVNPEDETTNLGAAQNVVSLLLLRGVLEVTTADAVDDTVTNVDVSKLRLSLGYKSKWLMLVGDGLTQMRMKTFNDMVHESSYNFGQQQKTFEVLREALGQVIHVTGDLHGGQFHFLSAIYTIFYPCLIQPVQELVAWKRISGSDVTKCYQQAAGLALMITTELERRLLPMYLHEVCKDQGTFDRMRYSVNPDVEEDIKEQEDFAVKLASQFFEWIESKKKNTTDDVFRMTLNYVQLMDYYRGFRAALSCGDAIMIEHLYKTFLPIFAFTGKKHYVEIVCSMMDQFYSKIGYDLLHLVRVNRTMPLYRGVDTTGRILSDWAMDSLIEVHNQEYTKMNFNNDLDGWKRHSSHVQMHNKSSRFVQSEYNRVWSDQGRATKYGGAFSDMGVDANKRQSAKPSRKEEKTIIAEFIHASGLCEEIPNRSYSTVAVYESMASVKTKFGDQETEKKARWLDEAMTQQERELSGVIENLFVDDERSQQQSSHANAANAANAVEMNFESIGFSLEEATEIDDGEEEEIENLQLAIDENDYNDGNNRNENDNNSQTENDNNAVNVNDNSNIDTPESTVHVVDGILMAEVGNGRRIKVRPSKLNKKAFCDIVGVSKNELIAKHLHVRRFRKKERYERERSRNQRIVSKHVEMNSSNTGQSSELLRRGIARMERRLEYRGETQTDMTQDSLLTQTDNDNPRMQQMLHQSRHPRLQQMLHQSTFPQTESVLIPRSDATVSSLSSSSSNGRLLQRRRTRDTMRRRRSFSEMDAH